eukprot:10786740-Lingulodinium_polyedra.AAC.1
MGRASICWPPFGAAPLDGRQIKPGGCLSFESTAALKPKRSLCELSEATSRTTQPPSVLISLWSSAHSVG